MRRDIFLLVRTGATEYSIPMLKMAPNLRKAIRRVPDAVFVWAAFTAITYLQTRWTGISAAWTGS
jgi:hypothetical protein